MGKKSTYPAFVLFDGFCNLCSRSVDFILKHDKNKVFRFVALQSEAGIFLRDKFEIPGKTDSVILWHDGRFYFHSDAALKIAIKLPFPWPLLGIFFVVPVFLRDTVYRWIARNRYRWFGKRESCRFPSFEEREFFPSVERLELEIARLETQEKI